MLYVAAVKIGEHSGGRQSRADLKLTSNSVCRLLTPELSQKKEIKKLGTPRCGFGRTMIAEHIAKLITEEVLYHYAHRTRTVGPLARCCFAPSKRRCTASHLPLSRPSLEGDWFQNNNAKCKIIS